MAAGRGNTKAVLAEVEFLRKVHPDTTRPGQPKDSLQTVLDRIEAAATPDPDERTVEVQVLVSTFTNREWFIWDRDSASKGEDCEAFARRELQAGGDPWLLTWHRLRVPLPDPEVEEIEGEVES